MDKKNVGFYKLICDAEQKRMIGALLVTDDLGKPEEFRVTHPVKPTLIQRQLYGSSLLPHVGVELCGRPILDALRSKPELLLVSDLALLALGDSATCLVAYVERAGTKIDLSNAAVEFRLRQEEVKSASGRFDPLRVTYPVSYTSDEMQHTTKLLADYFTGFDLVEPFQRIEVAIRMLQEQDEKFR